MTASHTLHPASFHALTIKLKANKSVAPFALQIGAMDGKRFDLLHPHLRQGGWLGLLIEPVEDMFCILQKTYTHQPDLKLVNCAIAGHDGTINLKRIDPNAISQGLIPEEALGITTGLSSGSLLNDPRLRKAFPLLRDEHVVEFSVPCMTLKTLLAQNEIPNIDLVMIDTEGADWLIAQQLDLDFYAPSLVCLEHSSLSESDKGACVSHFIDHDYLCAVCEEDLENILFYKKELHT